MVTRKMVALMQRPMHSLVSNLLHIVVRLTFASPKLLFSKGKIHSRTIRVAFRGAEALLAVQTGSNSVRRMQ